MSSDTLTVTGKRTGKSLPITDGAIRAMDLRQIRTRPSASSLTVPPSRTPPPRSAGSLRSMAIAASSATAGIPSRSWPSGPTISRSPPVASAPRGLVEGPVSESGTD